MCLVQKGEDGLRSHLCVHVCGAESPILLQKSAAPIALENAVYFSFSAGQLKPPSRSCPSGDELIRAGPGSVSDVDLFATYVAGKRSGELSIQPQSFTHFLSCCFTHMHVGQKESAFCGTRISLWPFYHSESPRPEQVMRFPGAWREEILSITQATSSSAPAQEEVDTLVLYSDKPETWEDHMCLQHFPLGQDLKCAWCSSVWVSYADGSILIGSLTELNFHLTLCRWCDALPFVRRHSLAFPLLPPAACHMYFGLNCLQHAVKSLSKVAGSFLVSLKVVQFSPQQLHLWLCLSVAQNKDASSTVYPSKRNSNPPGLCGLPPLAPFSHAWLYYSTGPQHNLQTSQPKASLKWTPFKRYWMMPDRCFTISLLKGCEKVPALAFY